MNLLGFRSMGVGMGVAMMMQQAGAIVGAAAPPLDPNAIQAQIRKAKVSQVQYLPVV